MRSPRNVTDPRTGMVAVIAAMAAISVIAGSVLLSSGAAQAATYKVDAGHSGVTFRIRHILTTVTGRFTGFEGTIVFDEKAPESASVQGSIEVATINTDNEKRDGHLQSPEFFDVAKYPRITFKTTKITDVDTNKNTAKVHGTLSMHGVEREIVLDGQFLGSAKDPWGNERAGFRGTATLDRKDYGLTWSKTLEGGTLLVGDDVEIELNVEAVKEP